MSFDPYLHFRGDCAAAMEFYANVFAADDLFVMRYSEMPEAPPVFADSNRVLHATLTLGGRMLMASDFPPGTEGDPQKAVSISHAAPDLASGRRIFDALFGRGRGDHGLGRDLLRGRLRHAARPLRDSLDDHVRVKDPRTLTRTA